VAVDEDGFLRRIIADATKDSRREGDVLAIDMFCAEIGELGVDADSLKMVVEPVGHPYDLIAPGGLAAHAVDEM
jgi:hypothetical protein